jgi:CheY-like chemotaxis protein
MYSIGEISRIVRISADTLRYYDQIGLLKPHHINGLNRYRQYSKDQVQDLLFIMEMKEYGFSLDAIRELLISKDKSRIEAALRSRSQELMQEHERIGRTIQHLDRKLNLINGEGEPAMVKTTVLIVDDSAFMRRMLGEILEKAGYKVIGEAADGEEGLKLSISLRPDFVIMDIHMPPGMDGIEASRKIIEAGSAVKILICSARAQPIHVLKAVQSGAQAFIAKPFQPDVLLDSLAELANRTNNPGIGHISGWLADKELTDKLPPEPASQDTIVRLLALCYSPDDHSAAGLLELLL